MVLGEKIELDKPAVVHVMTVLRLGLKDKIILFNGDGDEYPADIIDARHHHVSVLIRDKIAASKESPINIHLGQVISKAERMDYTLQKATELGVNKITPLFSTRCDLHFKGEREERKMVHWQRVLVAACEQCGRNQLPGLLAIQQLKDWLKNASNASNASNADNTSNGSHANNARLETKIFLDHHSEKSFKDISIGNSVGILVGPEGGFTFEEKQYAIEQGFTGITLGPRILRTETAGLVAISLIQFLAGDMG
jgi:16S rRNA (uracil1498-N3)-methyltransferase